MLPVSQTLASGILVNHQDLLQGFFDFVDTCPQVDFAYEEGKDPKRDEGLTSKEKSMLQVALPQNGNGKA